MARISAPTLCRASFALALAGAFLLASPAQAGNGANFVLYNQHTEEQGETEVKLFSDFSNTGGNDADYAAQLFEIEYGVTDYWTTAFYFEGDKIQNEDYEFGGFRFENRVRLFEYGTFLNPVLYVEYEYLKPAHRYIRAVTGRTDKHEGEEEEEEGAEHEIESRLILAQDLTDRFNVAFNWINETDLKSGDWEFGYAAGINYVLYDPESGEGGVSGGHYSTQSHGGWSVEELKLGIEAYGGLGDSVLGLTWGGNKTQQYLGVNLQAELENEVTIGIGGAFGLTDSSEDAIVRLVTGYEFE